MSDNSNSTQSSGEEEKRGGQCGENKRGSPPFIGAGGRWGGGGRVAKDDQKVINAIDGWDGLRMDLTGESR
jgi:hypothetical protein